MSFPHASIRTHRFSRAGNRINGQGRTTVAIQRFTCAFTLGHGFGMHFSHIDPAGSSLTVVGWDENGNVACLLPYGGVGYLGKAEMKLDGKWNAEVRAEFDALPSISLLSGDGMLRPCDEATAKAHAAAVAAGSRPRGARRAPKESNP